MQKFYQSKDPPFAWLLLFLLVSELLSSNTHGAEFNNQLTKRVIERIDEVMKVPVEATNQFLRQRNSLAFEHGLTAPDYGAVLKQMWVTMTETEANGFPTSIAIALEDGTYISYSSTLNYSTYREPGNDGYDVTDISSEDPNYKHWVSCFNTTNGYPTNCQMSSGMEYIECVNDCELVPCNAAVATEEKFNGLKYSSEFHDEVGNETIWCKNYAIEVVNEEDRRGYIPAVYQCTNEFGEVEQNPGLVLKEYKSQTMGNCYFGDGQTLVNRSIVADYAVCGSDGQTCDIPSKGAFAQYQYDPRYRDWYLEVKAKQRPIWNEPFLMLYEKLMVITYAIPFYTIPRRKNETETTTQKKAFEGVILADYKVDMINDFLVKEYSVGKVIFYYEKESHENVKIVF